LNRAEALASESGSIEDFLTELESDRQLLRSINALRSRAEGIKQEHAAGIGSEEEHYITAASLPAAAAPRDRVMTMPVSGQVMLHYGDSDDVGDASKGVHFSTRGGAMVVAPRDGTVRFAGTFG